MITWKTVRIVGTSYGTRDLRLKELSEMDAGSIRITLSPEPENQFDPWAIRVFANEMMIGYIPAKTSPVVLELLSRGDIREVELDEIGLWIRNGESYWSARIRLGVTLERSTRDHQAQDVAVESAV